MSAATVVVAAVAAALAGAALVALARWRAMLPLAPVTPRSLHRAPIPRVGGLAIWAGTVPVTAVAGAWPALPLGPFALPWLALVAVSLADDVRAVPVGPRLAVHAFAACWFVVALDRAVGGSIPWPLLALAALAVAWSLNLYNFMDGSDGLAAAMTITGFAAYAAVLHAQAVFAPLPVAVAAATVPLLVVNRPPARMFMGDVGAVPLGFLAAGVGIAGVATGVWRWWFPVLVFLPFIADASVTLARRALAGERVWEAHKSHHYQRLLQLGAGHGGTLAVFGALMLGTAASAALCATLAPAWGPPALAVWCAVHASVFAAIDYHWRRRARVS